MKKSMVRSNPVAKYALKFNKAKTYADRKRKQQTGYVKHKGKQHDRDE